MNGRKFSITELKAFFKTMDEIEKRIEEIAPLCTDITLREDITGFSHDEDGRVCIRVYSSDCGNDAYWFPIDYLTMDNERIEKCVKEKAELARKLREQEELKEKKEQERKERKEYERLKRKIEVQRGEHEQVEKDSANDSEGIERCP